jgi:hypothetical protein
VDCAHEGVGSLRCVLLLPHDEYQGAKEPKQGEEAVVVHDLLQSEVGDDATGRLDVLLNFQR